MESFEYLGNWWLPSTPDRVIGGLLTFSEEKGLQLKLSGVLDDYLEKWEEGEVAKILNRRKKNYSIINGITVEQNKKISLIENMHLGYSIGFPGINAESVYPRFAFLGHHFDDNSKINFNKLVNQIKSN